MGMKLWNFSWKVLDLFLNQVMSKTYYGPCLATLLITGLLHTITESEAEMCG